MRRFLLILFRITCAGCAVAASLGGCECQRSVEEGGQIDMQPEVMANPGLDRPNVDFPSRCQTPDLSLNKFVEHALQVCATGDYDGFRALFGTNFTPPAHEDFQRIWKGVESVEIVSVRAGPQEPPEYYVHAVVRFRPNPRGLEKRDAVVGVFKEGAEWRIAPPSKDIIRMVLYADSQPAEEPTAGNSNS